MLAAIILLVHGPYQLVAALALDRVLPEFGDPDAFAQFFGGEVAVDLLQRIVLVGGLSAIIGLLVHVLVGGAVVSAILELDHGRPSRAAPALRRSFQVSGGTLGASVLGIVTAVIVGVMVMVLIALLAVAVPPLGILLGLASLPLLAGIAIAVVYLVLPVAVVEETGPLRTLSRAWWVLRRRFWWVLGVTSLAVLLVGAISFGVQMLLLLLAGLAGPLGFLVEAAAGTLSALISVPVTVGAALLLYHDARIRGEGYDLRARAQGRPWG
ncbi:hypothetical protein [Egicoccus sp. AB-alg2]|uniref:hypothetical protein n=1 Tax=Egicoccus sp. AB-alg2 TaxID=3242693 RepID=UPI00359D7338